MAALCWIALAACGSEEQAVQEQPAGIERPAGAPGGRRGARGDRGDESTPGQLAERMQRRRAAREALEPLEPPPQSQAEPNASPALPDVPELPPVEVNPVATPQPWKDTDLVSIRDVDPTILVDIAFAKPDNAFHYQFFKTNEAYLRYGTARKLAAVQRSLQRTTTRRPTPLRLKIWSAYRPFAVQVKMFEIVGGNPDWVSDPWKDRGKRTHVRGVAVDCTVVDIQGNEVEMPTSYLDFANATRMRHDFMDLPQRVIANRALLMRYMRNEAMEPYVGEWWHYQDSDWARYPVIQPGDFPEVDRAILVDSEMEVQEKGGPANPDASDLGAPQAAPEGDNGAMAPDLLIE